MDTRNYRWEHSNKTSKPVHINIQKSADNILTTIPVDMIVTWFFEREYMFLYKDSYRYLEDLKNFEITIRDIFKIDNLTPSLFYNSLNKLKGKSIKNSYIFSNVKSNDTNINDYSTMLNWFKQNSKRGFDLKGLTKTVGTKLKKLNNLLDINLSESFNEISTILSALNSSLVEHIPEDVISFTERYGECTLRALLGRIKEDVERLRLKPFVNLSVYRLEKILKNEVDGNGINLPRDILMNSFFWYYKKTQFKKEGSWIGTARIYLNLPEQQIILNLLNSKLERIDFFGNNKLFDNETMKLICYVLEENNISFTQYDFIRSNPFKETKSYITLTEIDGKMNYEISNSCPINCLKFPVSIWHKELHGIIKGELYIKSGTMDDLRIWVKENFSDRLQEYKLKLLSFDRFKVKDIFPKFILNNRINIALLRITGGDFSQFWYQKLVRNENVDLFIDRDSFRSNIQGSEIYK